MCNLLGLTADLMDLASEKCPVCRGFNVPDGSACHYCESEKWRDARTVEDRPYSNFFSGDKNV